MEESIDRCEGILIGTEAVTVIGEGAIVIRLGQCCRWGAGAGCPIKPLFKPFLKFRDKFHDKFSLMRGGCL